MKYLFCLFISFSLVAFSLKEQRCYSVRASHILLQARTESEFQKESQNAKNIIARINKGESFEALAKEYGDDGTADTGGELGWFKRGVMVKPFEDACFNAQLNTPFEVRTQFGIHVVKVTDRKIIPCN